VEHFRQPVKRGIGIAAADAFDEGADRVVMGVVLRIVDDGFALDAFLDDGAGQVDGAVRGGIGGEGGEFEGVEAASGVAVANFGQVRGVLALSDLARNAGGQWRTAEQVFLHMYCDYAPFAPMIALLLDGAALLDEPVLRLTACAA
jgi:hypothetical protein